MQNINLHAAPSQRFAKKRFIARTILPAATCFRIGD
jgi:hypothetical protein